MSQNRKGSTLDAWLSGSSRQNKSNRQNIQDVTIPSSGSSQEHISQCLSEDGRNNVENPPLLTRQEVSPRQSVTSETAEITKTTDDLQSVSSQTAVEKPGVPTEPFHPPKYFRFPKTDNRSCQHSWFDRFKWLHYETSSDLLFCFVCMKAHAMGITPKSCKEEDAFLRTGFKNWKKGIEKLQIHEKSSKHLQSMEYIFNLENAIPISSLISEQAKSKQRDAAEALRVIVSSLRYLARAGQAIRGHTSTDGNLYLLLEERSNDIPSLRQWLERRDKWLSADIQNEIIEIMAHSIQRQISKEIGQLQFFSIIADGTTDVGGNEQFSIVIRYVLNDFNIKESFVGLYSLPDSKAQTLTNTILDLLLRLGLDIKNLRGHCFDGAANMAGRISGVQKSISEKQPLSLFVHCSNHSLDLALQELARNNDMACDALTVVKDVSNIILESSKRKGIYENLVLPPVESTDDEIVSGTPNHLLALCPTRWCVRVKSLKRFLDNYQRVLLTVSTLLAETGAIRDDRRASLRGYLKKMEKTETLFCLLASISVFGPCEQLSKSLQSPDFTASGAKQAAEVLTETLKALRTDESFIEIYDATLKRAEVLGLKEIGTATGAKPSRNVGPPRRYQNSKELSHPVLLSSEQKLRKNYFEMLDLIVNEVQRRFSQQSMDILIRLEGIVIEASKGARYDVSSLQETLREHAADFDVQALAAQLMMLPRIIPSSTKLCVSAICEELAKQPDTVQVLLDQVIILLKRLMTVPASVAGAERSFSVLRRLKNYLRSTMSQKRLTHLMLLNVHGTMTKNISIDDICREFVSRNSERKSTFGVFG